MGHKVHPKVYRIPTVYTWDSKWFASKKDVAAKFLRQETAIRKILEEKLKEAGVDAIGIERTPKEMVIVVLAAKPGFIIGRSAQGLEALRKQIEKSVLQYKLRVKINIQAVHQPSLSAKIVGQNMAYEIEHRKPFRRVMKMAIEKVMAAGAKGVKIRMSGRLNGAEIARRETLGAGKMSLITIRSDVDYALSEAQTIYGKIGIKVWIYHGETFSQHDRTEKKEEKKQ